jgi:hypothetical protein
MVPALKTLLPMPLKTEMPVKPSIVAPALLVTDPELLAKIPAAPSRRRR